jgi:hypothetical protein
MDAIDDALAQSDLFVSLGTSGSVYPAAGFVEQAKELRIRAYEINLEPQITLDSSTRHNMDPPRRPFLLGSRKCSQRSMLIAGVIVMLLELGKEQLGILRRAPKRECVTRICA